MMARRPDGCARLLGDLVPSLVGGDRLRRRLVPGLGLDSRELAPGDLWLALQGHRSHALDHLDTARERGVGAILAEPSADWTADRIDRAAGAIPVVVVPGLRRQAGEIAARFFGQPGLAMRVVGVTGTNGKTSVSHFLGQALATQVKTAVMGTLGKGFAGDLQPSTHTTEDAVAVQAALADFSARGARAVAMEVSSHALDQERVAGVPFHTAVFTNLSRDHQDYHGDMDSYAAAKARLFRMPGLAMAVINVDDPVGARFAADARRRVVTVAVGTDLRLTRHGDRYLYLREIETLAGGMRIRFQSSWGAGELHTHLLGRFNAYNLALALAVLLGWEMPPARAVETLSQVDPVPGRMMAFVAPGRPRTVVDYAHTPDALEQVLRSLREHTEGRLFCVFGCGGERDAGKRPLMGAAAHRLADRVIVTDDNPRGEDPAAIVADILSGMPETSRVAVEHDRAKAIALVVGMAGPDDVVLVAGKGHETYQERAGRRTPFSDIEQVQLALRGGAA